MSENYLDEHVKQIQKMAESTIYNDEHKFNRIKLEVCKIVVSSLHDTVLQQECMDELVREEARIKIINRIIENPKILDDLIDRLNNDDVETWS